MADRGLPSLTEDESRAFYWGQYAISEYVASVFNDVCLVDA
ncbi:MAG: hypothetical protein QW610_04300 [Pyrobaculum sp.]